MVRPNGLKDARIEVFFEKDKVEGYLGVAAKEPASDVVAYFVTLREGVGLGDGFCRVTVCTRGASGGESRRVVEPRLVGAQEASRILGEGAPSAPAGYASPDDVPVDIGF